jgi:GNAT superfamily N-acetyltransferase
MLTITRVRPSEVPTLLAFVHELAVYERLDHLVTATEADYQTALFGAGHHADAALACVDGQPVGYMVWFRSFSTFTARSKLYLEDLYVRPDHRGAGIGTAMLAWLARHAVDAGLPRLQWQVLDWNEPSIAFYRRLGANVTSEWLSCTLDGEPLSALADRAP